VFEHVFLDVEGDPDIYCFNNYSSPANWTSSNSKAANPKVATGS
jgi:hypothetical protein